MWWSSSSGIIELNITKKIAQLCSHAGHCDNDVNDAMQLQSIKNQLNKIDPVKLANELKEYGAWDETDLADHEANKMRILWIAAGDITENN